MAESSDLMKVDSGSITSSLFALDDEKQETQIIKVETADVENHENPDDDIPIAYRSPSTILNALNIDQRTHIDKPVSTITSNVDKTCCERTLAIIKPNAMVYKTDIEKRMQEEGFEILMARKLHLSPEQVSEFYASCYGLISFPTLIVYMSSAPVMVYCLAREKAINHWKKVIGPESVPEAELFWPSSLRAIYGKYDSIDNAVHGSKDDIAAKWEIRFFFPNTILEPIATDDAAEDYLNESINPVISKGLAELLKVKPIDPVIWFAEWLLWNNPNRPKLPETIARTKT